MIPHPGSDYKPNHRITSFTHTSKCCYRYLMNGLNVKTDVYQACLRCVCAWVCVHVCVEESRRQHGLNGSYHLAWFSFWPLLEPSLQVKLSNQRISLFGRTSLWEPEKFNQIRVHLRSEAAGGVDEKDTKPSNTQRQKKYWRRIILRREKPPKLSEFNSDFSFLKYTAALCERFSDCFFVV